MYLRNIAIKNIGPIEKLSVELPFKEGGDPKPVVFVGENGSGKTILQSQIVDSFYEIGSNLFEDVGKQKGLSRSYYKISGGLNLQTGKEKGFSALIFTDDEKNKIEYFDKIGDVKKEDVTELLPDFLLSPDNKNDNKKITTSVNEPQKEKLQNEWLTGVHFYQPAYRYEEPFWKNDPFLDHQRFEDKKRFSGKLDKEFEIISSTKENKAFLMDLVLDFTNDAYAQSSKRLKEIQDKINRNEAVTFADTVVETLLDSIIWSNVNSILRSILKKNNKTRFGVGKRGTTRVAIVEDVDVGNIQAVLPSIDNLSLGEAVLLNFFLNIIRHAPYKKLDEIQGIVVVDEVDVHLHTDLQNTVLPNLIKLFPKVQFIITTHAPLFVLGMQSVFGEENFEVRNMPKGELITTERFSEFENAYNVLKKTEKFESEVKKQVEQNKKPILLIEGKTDKKIFEKAWELLNTGIDFPYCIIDIKDGHNAKDVKFELEKADAFQSEFVFGVFDFDEEGYNQWNGLSTKEFETQNQILKKHKTKNYYALLLPCLEDHFKNSSLKEQIFTKNGDSLKNKTVFAIEHMFYDILKEAQQVLFVKEDIYGGSIIKFPDSKKNDFCDWICNNGTKEDFQNFEKIFEIIEKIINPEPTTL